MPATVRFNCDLKLTTRFAIEKDTCNFVEVLSKRSQIGLRPKLKIEIEERRWFQGFLSMPNDEVERPATMPRPRPDAARRRCADARTIC